MLPTQPLPDDNVLSKAGAEAQKKVSWNIPPDYERIYEVTSSLSTLQQNLDAKFFFAQHCSISGVRVLVDEVKKKGARAR